MIKFALVGCGRIAKRHSELLGGGIIEGAELVAVCDSQVERANSIGERFRVDSFGSISSMMGSKEIDVAVVLTESGNHAKHTIELAKYGVHVVVEKPMALRLSDADQMIGACQAAGVKLFVVKQNRFNLPVVQLKKALDAGRFGRLIMGTVRVRWCRPQSYYDQDAWRGTWEFDGGVLTNQASHHIDLLEWIFGDVESVYAKSMTAIADIEAEDTAVVILKFASGALGVIEATTAIRPRDLEGSLSVMGSKGSVEIGGFAVNEIKHWNFEESVQGDEETLERFSVNPPNVYGFGHQAYYEHVIRCLTEDEKPLVDGLEGRRSLQLINAIYESIETGNEVYLGFVPRLSRLGR